MVSQRFRADCHGSRRSAFRTASKAINFGARAQVPELDDTGNGIPNELLDGLFANQYSIGSGGLTGWGQSGD